MHSRSNTPRYVTFLALIAFAVFVAVRAPRPTLADQNTVQDAASMAHRADGSPAVPTATDPAAPALPAATGPRWRIHIRAFPDGVGAGGQRCQGCDGHYSGADQFVAGARPLKDVNVVVRGYRRDVTVRREDWEPHEIWRGNIAQPNSRHPEAEYTIVLDQPPPYLVYLDKNPDGYALCPNAGPWRTFEPKDFDSPGGRPGAGRQVDLTWFFWSCAGEKLGQDLPEPDVVLGGVICGIYCWLDRARGNPVPTQSSGNPVPTQNSCYQPPNATPVFDDCRGVTPEPRATATRIP